MVLISIHPFAFRRLLLVVLALACFSALCFADPVLMVRRYSRENSRTAVLRTAALAQPSEAQSLPLNPLGQSLESGSSASMATYPFSPDETLSMAIVPAPSVLSRHCEWRAGAADLGRPESFSVSDEQVVSR
jgi:hypothetical protein